MVNKQHWELVDQTETASERALGARFFELIDSLLEVHHTPDTPLNRSPTATSG